VVGVKELLQKKGTGRKGSEGDFVETHQHGNAIGRGNVVKGKTNTVGFFPREQIAERRGSA